MGGDRDVLTAAGTKRIVMLCDWLPPDFGAVGQYAVGFAGELAAAGHEVTLVGFSSTSESITTETVGSGVLRVQRMYQPTYDRSAWLSRALWTLRANVSLLWHARHAVVRADEVQFTGSPPYLLHFVMPVARLAGIGTRYRITDFHPECLMALQERPGLGLRLLSRLTNFWRRRVDVIEVLGNDQRRRLTGCGVDPERIELRRDPSPVDFGADTGPVQAPAGVDERRIVLYSGNWGTAHDHETFVEGYRRFCERYPDSACLWLNATGARVGAVVSTLSEAGLPYVRTPPVPLSTLAGVLCAADLHLITLDDRFVGYVMPSKVYACIASRRPILFIGSADSDVHTLCVSQVDADSYRRVDVGDPTGVASALEFLLVHTAARREPQHRNGTTE